jgi:hypothetical protein
MNRLFFAAAAFLLASCAAYRTFNQTTRGDVRFPGGVHKEETWDDAMVFRRASWYHGMTLYYDALVYTADPASPFSKWFSSAEKEYFERCERLLVTVNYSADATKISHVMFREQMRFNGYDDVVVNTFASSVKTHPGFQAWNLPNYKILGYCKRRPAVVGKATVLAVTFPSFRELMLDL